MARARNIKPGVMLNEDLADLAPLTRLLFIYLWMLADREGRLQDRPKRIKAEALPHDKDADIEGMLCDLAAKGFVLRYETKGKRFIQVIQFSEHQRPHSNESASEIPPYDPELCTLVESTCDHGEPDGEPRKQALRPDSLILRLSDSLIPEEPPTLANASVAPPCATTTKPRAKHKTAMPPDFGISPRVSEWACEKGYSNLPAHLESFRAKCNANGYRYVDWDSAFMEAIRADWAGLAKAQGNGAKFDPTAFVNRNRRPGA